MDNNTKIKNLIEVEEKRQQDMISLIPSENLVSRAVKQALASSFTNKYAEGYSGKRYYFGNKAVDAMEDKVKDLAFKVFNINPSSWGVNVQPYSGSIANLATYSALLKRGEKILAMSLDHGGHLTHGHKVSFTGKLFDFRHYGVDKDGYLNYKEIKDIAKEFKPKLIVCGASAYSRKIDFKKFKSVAKSVGAILMVDMAHIAGLIAGGAHSSPFPYADVVTSTTHKTLRGPRGAIIFSKKKFSETIDKTVFPGLQGGPQLHTISAMGVAFEEALSPSFKAYAKQTILNAGVLAENLLKLNYNIVSGGTDNHLFLVDLSSGIGGKKAGEMLEDVGIVVNKNMIPYDTRSPLDPSGIRLGTPSITTRGMREKEMAIIAELIDRTIRQKSSLEAIKKEVKKLANSFLYNG